ncbi:pyridoxamine 5'-phosphate oxidase [Brachybacterium paraconglomeratum]|uniref:pyridoxamine 5'-phosphate oxidase n=1 Tax=Brachybacterium paraconglomeratum TaxID=173362 RepID=UPI0021A2DA91|nr:pyridoxamine 5'-phosphate oxidase [Brachybacterium paraconglomeratum]MCT1908212.1 pyridoxamine 5'-phosphate oxidase [Brachybacterium paraconglomeratum]
MTSASDRLAGERLDYLAGSLADAAPADPLALCDAWLQDAFARRDSHGDITDPTAVVLSTVALDADGAPRPRSRTVLLKGLDEHGASIYTNLDSDKARELRATPRASLLLPWYPLQRQVRIEGAVEKLSAAESDAYWATRPRGSQLGAWASHQSRRIDSRESLEAQYDEVEARFEGAEVPRPEFWGGLRIRPERIEFWQGRAHRVHDRIVYERSADGAGAGDWERHRLQP